MVRTQIQLTEKQAISLKERAKREKVSVAELIRRAVDESLEKRPASEEAWERALAAVGFLGCGPADLSENHDEYLAEAYSS